MRLALCSLSFVLALTAWPAAAQQEGAGTSLIYELLDRVGQLEKDVRELRGEIEVLRYQQQQQGGEQGQAQSETPRANVAPASPPAAAADAAASDKATYEAAIVHLREGRYDEAIGLLENFNTRFTSSPLTGNALYWLGESYFMTGDYAHARDTLLQFGAGYPNSEKLPEAMLRLGQSYARLGDTGKAREVLRRLTQAYPGTAAATQASRQMQDLH
ncbi:tol-pal system protein YbgF [Plasticicumulans acidivorans]|uniref:Cell division coordinator CpoB n=1 Tax=Plasticicumulans acidivorans TaxID=886464 RepID=A0A317MYK2_9GAMM|nr:tol-pal system protein YbgF [Plasticicumulans acidivorans]PWV60591.1 tol-pal system protein YbgF [Plasticicumulans acidivorans]